MVHLGVWDEEAGPQTAGREYQRIQSASAMQGEW